MTLDDQDNRGPCARATAEETVERLAVVEAALERGWSIRVEGRLAERFGVTRRQIRRYRRHVERRWSAGLKGAVIERERAGAIGRLHRNIAKAATAEDFRAVAALETVLARVVGTEQATEIKVTTMTQEQRSARVTALIEKARERSAREQ